MKLKKIASLMLAGVMAVSMLAGCNTASNGGNNGEGEGEGEGTTTSGYSAMLGEKAADALKKADKDKLFTFTDNADDQKALAAASVNLNDTLIETWVKTNTIDKSLNEAAMLNAFTDKAGLDRSAREGLLVNSTGTTFISDLQPANTVKVGEVWAANGTVDMDVVLDKIFTTYEDAFKAAPKQGTIAGQSNQTVVCDYSYTVSVSVVNVPARSNLEFSGSVNLVAVTLTRTGELA